MNKMKNTGFCIKCDHELEIVDCIPDMEEQDGSYTNILRCTNCGTMYSEDMIATNFKEIDG